MSDAVEALDLESVLYEIRLTVAAEDPAECVMAPVGDLALVLAEVDRLRAALATARRDALTEAAERYGVGAPVPGTVAQLRYVQRWLRARAAQEEDR